VDQTVALVLIIVIIVEQVVVQQVPQVVVHRQLVVVAVRVVQLFQVTDISHGPQQVHGTVA
jgi:hypothetical protein